MLKLRQIRFYKNTTFYFLSYYFEKLYLSRWKIYFVCENFIYKNPFKVITIINKSFENTSNTVKYNNIHLCAKFFFFLIFSVKIIRILKMLDIFLSKQYFATCFCSVS